MIAAAQLMVQFYFWNLSCLGAVLNFVKIANLETRMAAQGGEGGTPVLRGAERAPATWRCSTTW